MGYKVAQSASQNAMSITTIDTKTGEVKQITQDELVDLLKEAAENPKESDPMPISVEQLQKILESVPQGDQDPLTIQGMGYKFCACHVPFTVNSWKSTRIFAIHS